jgi:hypothetical protein
LDYFSKNFNLVRQELVGDVNLYATNEFVGVAGGADLAEYYYANQILEPGDVVAIDPSQPAGITRSGIKYQTNLLGVVSTEPGLILGPYADNAYPIALSGRVPVKITNENGSIRVGDLLTSSSRPGYAMRATLAGATVGRVLNEPEELVPCGQELPEMDQAISDEGPGVIDTEIQLSAADTPDPLGTDSELEVLSSEADIATATETANSSGQLCGYAMVFVGLSETHGASVLELARTYASTQGAQDVDYITQSEAGLISTSALPASIATQQQILAFLRSTKDTKANVTDLALQSIFTERLAAAIDVLTPSLYADEIYTKSLQSQDGRGLDLALQTGESFSIKKAEINSNNGGTEASSVITFDSQGNAMFAGKLTASAIEAQSISGLDVFAERIAHLSDAVNSLSPDQSAVSVNDLIAMRDLIATMSNDLTVQSQTGDATLTARLDTTEAAQLTMRDELAAGLLDLTAKVTTLETGLLTVVDKQVTQDAILTDLANRLNVLETAQTLALTALNLNGDLTVSGTTALSGAVTIDTLGSKSGMLTLTGDMTFIGRPYLNADAGGFAVIRTGDRQADVVFDKEYLAMPTINATVTFEEVLDNPDTYEVDEALINRNKVEAYLAHTPTYVVYNKSVRGFSILLSEPVPYNLRFSWSAQAIKDAKVVLSSPEPVVTEPSQPQPVYLAPPETTLPTETLSELGPEFQSESEGVINEQISIEAIPTVESSVDSNSIPVDSTESPANEPVITESVVSVSPSDSGL